MRWSLKFGKIAGIKVQMHWTFLILIAWIIISEVRQGSSTETILYTVGYVLCIFICVILHEFGHALTARRFGVKTRSVTLLPIGGLANIERIPEKPKQEFLVAVMGPAVNVVIAALLLLVGSFTLSDLTNQEMLKSLQSIGPDNFLFALTFVNLFLVVFNAIPAFPMDGGRVLRALLSFRIPRTQATNIAARIGQFVGVVFILLGFFGNFLLILIGLFVIAGAYSENVMVKQMEILKGHMVGDAMMTNFTSLKSDESLGTAADRLLAGAENNFIVVDGNDIAGILTKENLVQGLKELDRDKAISNILKKDFKILKEGAPLNDVFMKFQRDKSKQKLYPVMDKEDGELKGVIDLENVQEYIMLHSARSND